MGRHFRCSLALLALFLSPPAAAQPSFVTFESGQVRPLALSPSGQRLFALNTPDNRLEIFRVTALGLRHTASVPVGMEPVAVAARSESEVWVVNHLSDSVSVVDLLARPPRVVRTLFVGDEPRDIVFAGRPANRRAFISTAHRGQQRTHPSLAAVPGAGDSQLTTPGIGRADVWVFDAADPGPGVGGTPLRILSFFSDTPRALAVDRLGGRVYVAAFFSGNQTTAINEGTVCNGFGGGCGVSRPSGVIPPAVNAQGFPAPETGIIVKYDGEAWRDVAGNDWSRVIPYELPDHDVFSIDARTLDASSEARFDHVGTILFNMVVNPKTGKVYVTNTELPNDVRFEGPGVFGGSTVQGHLSESRVTVIDPVTGVVEPQHLNPHIDYSRLHTDEPDLVDPTQIEHSLATPLQPVVSRDGGTLYVAAFGSSKVGVFETADIESPTFEADFDPRVASARYLETSGGPSGLALDEQHRRLFVLTRFDNSVSAIDLATGDTTGTWALHNPEPASVVEGRPFLYDATLTSGNGEASCASCHIFADFDGLAWNLGDPDALVTVNNQPSAIVVPPARTFHPLKGPMTTQTLRGLATHGALHWRGDRLDGFFGVDPCDDTTGAPCNEEHSFMNFIVAFEGLVGMDGTISEEQMQQFTDFTLQIMLPPNPQRPLDNSLTPAQQAGVDVYTGPITDTAANCNGCHNLGPARGFFGTRGRQSFEGEPQNMKVPHLRNVYQKLGMFFRSGPQVRGFGFLHDGSVDTLKTFFGAGVFNLTSQQEDDLEQFAFGFPTDLAPAVGQQVTLTENNSTEANPRIDLLLARSNAVYRSLMLGGTVTECDLVVKGHLGRVVRGWLHDGGDRFIDDLGDEILDADLRALVAENGPLTYTCAPPGSGHRMGIDRDEDALLDGVETGTGVFVSASNTGSDPADADTDDDGVGDFEEVAAGTDPNCAGSCDLPPRCGLLGIEAVVFLTPLWLRRRARRG